MSSVGIHHPQHALLNISNPPGQCSVTQKAKYSDFPHSAQRLRGVSEEHPPLESQNFYLIISTRWG